MKSTSRGVVGNMLALEARDCGFDSRLLDQFKPAVYHRRNGKVVDMTCATCGRQQPWDSDHFPIRIYAWCWTCVLDEHLEVADKYRSRQERRLRTVVTPAIL